jgi:hypothetical protein
VLFYFTTLMIRGMQTGWFLHFINRRDPYRFVL